MTGKPKKAEDEKKSPTDVPGKDATGTSSTGPKRVILKTIKRTAATPPPPPTLHKVSGGLTRRVLPKAPPRPVPPPPPPPPPVPPPAPVVATPAPIAPPVAPEKVAPVSPAPVAPTISSTPKTSAAVPEVVSPVAPSPSAAPKKTFEPPAVKTPEKEAPKKDATKSEPTATYKMPLTSTTPLRSAPRPQGPRPLGISDRGASGSQRNVSSATAQNSMPAAPAVPEGPRSKIKIPEVLTVKELSDRLQLKPIEVIKKLLGLGTMVTINQQIDSDTAVLAADAFGVDAEVLPFIVEKEAEEKEDPALLQLRPPIVTIMGHVDHGKTSLLDTIRKTRVAEKEAGGITQHIGAYRVSTPKGDVVFLDTPGHEAFTAMRSRGAQATDIVVLVVAADDGVMPQTVEAIDHAKAAGVTIVVAVNKIDLPNADTEKIRRELAQYDLVPEAWGGKTVFVEISAKKGTNVDKLLEMLSLESELLELKANPNRLAQGVVVEARMDPRRGTTATLLVQKGTLNVSDIVVAGNTFGRIKALLDDKGERITSAGPSTPVEVLGLSGVPQAGDRFTVMTDEKTARTLVEKRQAALSEDLMKRRHVTLENLHERVAEGKVRDLKIIIKADVQGSVQALRDSLEKMSTAEIRLNVLHAGVGGITETDVALADASDAVIIGFNVRPETKAEEIARRDDVSIRSYRIIYEIIADIRAAMEGLLEPETSELRQGLAEVRQVFKLSRGVTVAGSFVREGKIQRSSKARLIRDNVVVYEGSFEALKRFKDDVREIDKGFECGISLANYQDMKPGDIIESYTQESKARKLEPAP